MKEIGKKIFHFKIWKILFLIKCCDLRWRKGVKYEYYCIESAAHSSETLLTQFHRVSQADTRTHTHSLHSQTQHLDDLCYFEPGVGRRIGDKKHFGEIFLNFPRFVEFSGRRDIRVTAPNCQFQTILQNFYFCWNGGFVRIYLADLKVRNIWGGFQLFFSLVYEDFRG